MASYLEKGGKEIGVGLFQIVIKMFLTVLKFQISRDFLGHKIH